MPTLFPELRSILEPAFNVAEPGTEYVIMRYQNANLRTELLRTIERGPV